MRNTGLRTARLAWGLVLWQRTRFFGLALVAMCLTLVFTAADASYDVALEQTRASVESTYRGFHLQIVPNPPVGTLEGAVAVQNDEVLLTAGSGTVQVTRTLVGADAVSTYPAAARFGLLVSGRHPAAAYEVSLSEAAAERLGVSVGDSVEVAGAPSKVVGIIALPTRPAWAVVAGIATPAVSQPTAWLLNEAPAALEGSGYQSTGVNFETMLTWESIDQGPLGFVRYFRPTFLVLAACLFGFLVMLLHSGLSVERRGLVAAGMGDRQASAVVSTACALSGGLGILGGRGAVALALLRRGDSFGRLLGMRWVDVPVRLQPWVAVFGLALVGVALLAPVMPARRPAGRRALRKAPLPRSAGWVALGLCVAGVAMILFPNSRAHADLNMWLALAGAVVFSLAAPVVFAAATGRSRRRVLSYVARQRSRHVLTAVFLLALVAFVAGLAATHYAHYAKLQESWYRPVQPAGSLAVREVTDPNVLERLAAANPGEEISTRSDATGLLALRPSIAADLLSAATSIDEPTLVTADAAGLTMGQVGEPAEVWTAGARPDEHTVLADPALIEGGQVVIGRLTDGRFMSLATVEAAPSALLGGGGAFPDVVVDSLARYGGAPNEYRDLALLGFVNLPSGEQGRLEGLARSLAPTAFIDIDAGYQDGGLYAFSQLLGCGAAFLVGLIALGLGFQLISEERELRQLALRSGRSRAKRRMAGMAAFAPLTLTIALASIAALAFTRDTGDPDLPQYGYAPLAFVLAALAVDVTLALVHARRPRLDTS